MGTVKIITNGGVNGLAWKKVIQAVILLVGATCE